MSDLRTDFKDDVLNITTNEKRKYRMINNADGTVSFEDVTDYVQQGDTFGASEVNQITEKVNSCLTKADVVDNTESTATDLPLSANMGMVLKEELANCAKKSDLSNCKIRVISEVIPTTTSNEWCTIANINNYGITDYSKIFVQYNMTRTVDNLLVLHENPGIRIMNGYIQMIFTSHEYDGMAINFLILYI